MKKDIHIRITEENYKRLKSKSKQLNITQTEFIERFISNGEIVIINDLVEMQRQLRYIGNNLNQLTKLCHEGRIECLNLLDVKKEVGEIWQLLNLLIQSRHLKH